jgi:alpha-tubulin suppressor-like RCC1 family protein
MTQLDSTPFLPNSRLAPAQRLRRLIRRPAFVLASALVVAAPGCREDAESPTAPEAGPTLHITPAHVLSFHQVSGGWVHTCGVTTDNWAYCWGDRGFGQLGDGTSDIHPRLTPVAVLGGLHFRQVSAGGTHTCGVTTDNRAYCWGANSLGQLGDGTTTMRFAPVAVMGGLRFAQVDAGIFHTCGLSYPDRRAYCWGSNSAGQLGDGSVSNRAAPVAVLGGRQFHQVSAGESHTCGVTSTSKPFCWGRNQFGQLGDSTTTTRLIPVSVAGGRQFRQMDAGWTFTCAVTSGDRAFCWGQGRYGQLGNGKTGRRLWPGAVAGGLSFERVTAGWRHACGETTANRAYCWGLNNTGALGVGTSSGPELCNTVPCSSKPVGVLGGLYFRQLSAGQVHTCGKTPADVAYCWGANSSGTVGDGTTDNRLTPTPVAGPTE